MHVSFDVSNLSSLHHLVTRIGLEQQTPLLFLDSAEQQTPRPVES
jgi:hypothetical protein